MKKRAFVVSLMIAGAVATTLRAQESLNSLLKPYLEKYQLPALAAAVVKDGKIVAAGAVGTRRAGADIPVTLNDKFHLGSDTKAMTALLAGMFVEGGKLKWSSTISEVFPELAKEMDPGLKQVTLAQLLTHTSGIPSDGEEFLQLIGRSAGKEGNLDEQRYWIVKEWSKQPLVAKPGTKFAYSNMNYIIAGAMMEKVSGKTWDELITDRVFRPLGLTTAGLGMQASLGKVDAPLGHILVDGKPKAMLAGPDGDSPPIVGPAGIAHMSVLDFAKWAGWNAGLGKREPMLVKPETMRLLQKPVTKMADDSESKPGTPKKGGYAMGWGEMDVEWAANPLVFHGGSNTKNLAHVWLDPRRDSGLVMMTNISGTKAEEGLFALAPELYKKYVGTVGSGAAKGKR